MIRIRSGAKVAVIVIIAAFMLSLFPSAFTVSAADTFTLSVNYDLELLSASGAESNLDSNKGKVIYMYSPGVSSTASGKRQASEKWYPMYNNQIELKKFIPNTSDRDYVIAVRLAAEIPDENGAYASRQTVILRGRPNISNSDFKNKVVYSPRLSMVLISSDLKNLGYDYKVGECTWVLGMTDDLYIDPSVNFLGGVVTVRQTANYVTKTFSSNEFKVKIPAAASMPNIKVNEKTKKIIGIGKNQAWSTRGDGSTDFTLISDKNISLDDIPRKFTALENLLQETITRNGVKTECYVIFFKTLADDKKPESPTQKLYIPKSLINVSSSPTIPDSTTEPTTVNEQNNTTNEE